MRGSGENEKNGTKHTRGLKKKTTKQNQKNPETSRWGLKRKRLLHQEEKKPEFQGLMDDFTKVYKAVESVKPA